MTVPRFTIGDVLMSKAKRQIKLPTIEQIEEEINSDSYAGWCTYCGDWTHDSCEPDARNYECPECGHNTCFGAEELVVQGLHK